MAIDDCRTNEHIAERARRHMAIYMDEKLLSMLCKKRDETSENGPRDKSEK
jgi:hypothetical protein